MHPGKRLKWAAIDVAKAIDRRPGVARNGVRLALSAVASVTMTARDRRLTTLRWVPREGRWHHRWPQGRLRHVEWQRSPMMWTTHGGDYDMEDLLWRHYRPRAGDTVIDIGAGDGGEAFWLTSMVGPAGRVIAVEAAAGPFARLDELRRINAWTNVECLHAAVSDQSGTLTISDDDDEWIAGNVYGQDGIDVRAVTIDELCREHDIDHVDWMKMNIEGAEKDALRGMERMAPHVANLTISCHDFLGTEWGRSKALVVAWLEDHGFTVVDHGGDEAYLADYVYAWR